ncbi:hypothetical protein C8Q80DRAFT_1094960 [Daedaleopsis nitida]|nr:hypothetical protein C8Q80DRAFT_1094960 [Daedaleopsis nitida]
MFSSSFAALVGSGFYCSLLAAALLPSVAARFASIHFSRVTQCGNFTVSFAGGKAPAALPLTLSVLPLNSTPVFIPLPIDAWNSTTKTGAAITFLPFTAGTEFIASLDDANGLGTALVSDILVIDPAESDDTSCLDTNPAPFVPRYAVNAPLRQCESFDVEYDPNTAADSPTVRAFVPKGKSFPVNQTVAAISATGTDNYLMDVPRDSTVVLMFKDSNGYAETTGTMPVLGDVNSDDSCVPTNPLSSAAILDYNADQPHARVTTKITVIIIAVCVGVVALVALVMIIWCIRSRRRTKRANSFSKVSSRDPEKQMIQSQTGPRPLLLQSTLSPVTSPVSPADSAYIHGAPQQFVRDPPYIRMGSALVTPTSPDPNDPFGEQASGSILGPLSASARTSLKSRPLGSTALGNVAGGSSTLALQNSMSYSPAVRSSGLRRSSTFDMIPGTSPYWGGRLAVTPDNSLASNPSSLLRRQASFASARTARTGSVSSVEIDRILEMATIYGAQDILPDMPQPVHTAPATLRQSAYMAGRESRRTSAALTGSPYSSPAHSRNNSATAGAPEPASALSHSGSQTSLRMLRAYREPPLATLPSSPLNSPGIRPSLDMDGAGRASQLQSQQPHQSTLARAVSTRTMQSVYSEDGSGLEGFSMLQPPPRRR